MVGGGGLKVFWFWLCCNVIDHVFSPELLIIYLCMVIIKVIVHRIIVRKPSMVS